LESWKTKYKLAICGMIRSQGHLRGVGQSPANVLGLEKDIACEPRARSTPRRKKVAPPHLLIWYRLPRVGRIIGTLDLS
jgi:hypothetical protein